MSNFKQRAVQLLAQHGIAALPTRNNLKHPQGEYKQYLDERIGEIPAYWDEYGEDATGAFMRCERLPETHLILDCDWHEDRYFEEFEASFDMDLSELTVVQTTSGGRHLYVQCPNPIQFPGKLTVTFADGVSKGIDVRCAGKDTGIMLPCSQATNKNGEVGCYEALGEGTEDAIYSLEWSTITVEQQQKLEDQLGKKRCSESTGETGSAVGAAKKLMAPLMESVTDFHTNDFCTSLGNIFGAIVRTQAPAGFLAPELWQGLLDSCTEAQAKQLEGHPRHQKSFVTNATNSIEITQLARRNELAEARNPVLVDIVDPFEKEVYEYLGGAIRAEIVPGGEVTITYLPGAGYARLHADNDGARRLTLENGFVASGGQTWLQQVRLRLGIHGKEIKDATTFERKLKEWLLRTGSESRGNTVEQLQTLKHAISCFDGAHWEIRKSELSENQSKRWLWSMASDGTGQRRDRPFVARWENAEYIGIPSTHQLTDEAYEFITHGNKFVYSQTGTNKGQQVWLYPIPEGINDV
jgi:bifunctional DNA primase/polymerase-like protein